MVMVLIVRLMEKNTKEIGNLTNNMEKVYKLGKMALNMRDIINLV
jgi:hypothetical protein